MTSNRSGVLLATVSFRATLYPAMWWLKHTTTTQLRSTMLEAPEPEEVGEAVEVAD
jgi:hypothetical protein